MAKLAKSRRARMRAYAKINLGLKILGRREDGFHELRTVYQTISLADRVELEIAPRGSGVDLEVRGLEAPADGSNLAWRAAEAGAAAFGIRGRIRIRLHKRIPSGAGLGGGSSDAAAVLRLLAQAARRRPPEAELYRVGAELGSDVPLFLLGGTVLGLGRGEEVYPLPELRGWHCVVAMPQAGRGGAIRTPEAFAAWDAAHPGLTAGSASATLHEFCSLVSQVLPASRPGRDRDRERSWPKVHAGIENDFQPEVFSLSPDFPRIHRILLRHGAAWVSLTGSGAAQYGLFHEADQARRAAAALQPRYRSWSARLVSWRQNRQHGAGRR